MLLKRPITAIMLIIAVLIFGGIALSNLSVNLLPEVDSPTLLVRTDWSGAAPREIEQRINEPLEGLLGTVQGLQQSRGFARQGQSIISLRFNWGQNMDLAFLNVREKLDQVRDVLPAQAERPQLVQNSASDEPIAVLGISSATETTPDFDTRLELKRWAEQVLARRLEQADGIAQAVLVGQVEPEVHIRYRPQQLSRYGVTLAQVQSTVEQANLFTATGELRDGWYRYSLKIQSRIQSLDDVRAIPIKSLGTGRVITLADVATVQMQAADPTSFALAGARPVLSVLVKKEYGANTVEAFDTMVPLLEQLRAQNQNVTIQVLQENAGYIRNTISNLLQTLLVGAVLAFIILFLFLDDFRTPFTIGVSIPVSIFITFFVMYLADIQLNIVSLSGLTLGIGLLVDNAIIVLENINRYRQQGLSVLAAAAAGTKEIALAVTASTLTTISVFLPLVFLGGFEGAFFKDQALTLSISLLGSLAVALLILPVLVVQVQKRSQGGPEKVLGFNTYFNRLRDAYERSLQRVLRHRWLLFIAMGVMLAVAVIAFVAVKKSILPISEPQEVRFQVRLPGNTAIQSSRDAALALMQILPNDAELPPQVLGGYTDQTNIAALSDEGLNKFTVRVPVSGQPQATRVQQDVEQFIAGRSGWAVQLLESNDQWGVLPAADAPPLVFRLVGENRAKNQGLMPRLQQQLAAIDSSITLQKQYPEMVDTYQLQFKNRQLMQLGITEQDVLNYLSSLTRGNFVTDWNRQDENIAIRLVGYDRRVYDPADIVLQLNGRDVPLSLIADISRSAEPEQLERLNQTPVLSYVADVGFSDWWWQASSINNQLANFSRQTGTEVRVGGAARSIAGLLEQMGLLLAISVLVIYIILAIQFESLSHPLIILAAVPFAWVGSLTVLWLTGISLNALSFMGILILTGIAVNDSILKVDFMRRYYNETGNLDEAITQAGLNRFRPVVMTSLTTIVGLIPMLLPFGDGYAFRLSLSVALMGGMVTGTLLTLYVIPAIFQWAEERKQ